MALIERFQAEMENHMKTIEEIVNDWAESPPMPMNDFFISPDTDNYSEWEKVPGCYRIVEDPRLSVTLWVGEGYRLYRVYAHRRFRHNWVQMIAITASPDDRGDWYDWRRQFQFRRKVEDAGAARFKPIYGPQHAKYRQ
jgi:hypothetical protein